MAEARRKIRAKEIVEDVRSGLSDAEIREKHDLTEHQIGQVFSQLLQIGALSQYDLELRPTGREEKEQVQIKCESCGKSYSDELTQCPECGLSNDAGREPPVRPIAPLLMPPPRPAKPLGLIVAAIAVIVTIITGVGIYLWFDNRKPVSTAAEPPKKAFLSTQDLAQAYADQNELSSLVAMGAFDEIKAAASKPDFNFFVDAPDIDSRTLLMVAVENGRFDVAELLLYYGANMYSEDSEGNTPAILATKKGFPDIVALLVRKGYDVDFKNRHGETVRSLAHDKNDNKLLEIVLEGTKMPEYDKRALREMLQARMDVSRSEFCERLCVTHASPKVCKENCMKYYGIRR